jgi:hypothetical protein
VDRENVNELDDDETEIDHENDLNNVSEHADFEHMPENTIEHDNDTNNEQAQDDLNKDMTQRYGPRSSAYNLRPRKARNYSHLFTTDGIVHTTVDGASLATPQKSMKKGIKIFGSDGIDAVRSELRQLHDRSVMRPRFASDISKESKRAALAYLMFLNLTKKTEPFRLLH